MNTKVPCFLVVEMGTFCKLDKGQLVAWLDKATCEYILGRATADDPGLGCRMELTLAHFSRRMELLHTTLASITQSKTATEEKGVHCTKSTRADTHAQTVDLLFSTGWLASWLNTKALHIRALRLRAVHRTPTSC